MNDGTTDAGIQEQEVIYVCYFDPDDFEPRLAFLTVAELTESQDAPGLKRAILEVFKQHGMASILNKIVFLASDGAAVNSGLKSDLITLLKEDFVWLPFIWCFSHRLELALKDSLRDFIKPLEQTLVHLYYLYKKSSKKLRELKLLADVLREQYSFESGSIRPEKATGTPWIDHKLRAMAKLNNKFGIYAAHLENVISDTSKQCDWATLQGKLNNMTDAKVLLRSAFLFDLLSPAKILSLVTQKECEDIITIVSLVQSTREKYKKLQKIYEANPEKVFEQMPTLRSVLGKINDNNEYRGIKLKYLDREKEFIKNNCSSLIQGIVNCFDERYGSIIENSPTEGIKEAVEGDTLLAHFCVILNTKVWPTVWPTETSSTELLTKQFASLKAVLEQYAMMQSLSNIECQDILDSYSSIVCYSSTYFTLQVIPPLKMWNTIFSLSNDTDKCDWKFALKIVEIALCAPQSNAALERFFSQLKFIKTNLRTSLSEQSLNALLRIKVTGPSLQDFHKHHVEDVLNLVV